MITAEVDASDVQTSEHATYTVDVRRERMVWRAVAVVALVLGAGPVWQVWQGVPPTPVALEAGDPLPVAPTGVGDIVNLRPAVQRAVERAVIAADREGVVLGVTSGWRDSGKQQQLYDAAIAKYGSAAKARRWVLPPRESQHVKGGAVDIGPSAAASWLEKNGVRYGLCRRYANEPWHFELLAPHKDQPCPTLEPHA